MGNECHIFMFVHFSADENVDISAFESVGKYSNTRINVILPKVKKLMFLR